MAFSLQNDLIAAFHQGINGVPANLGEVVQPPALGQRAGLLGRELAHPLFSFAWSRMGNTQEKCQERCPAGAVSWHHFPLSVSCASRSVAKRS